MNRRSFLTSLLSSAAAVSTAGPIARVLLPPVPPDYGVYIDVEQCFWINLMAPPIEWREPLDREKC